MSSRSRDTGRHYASGSAKRKAKDEKEKKNEAVLSKTRKLFDFFNVQSDVAESTENKAKHTEVASHCTYNSFTTTVSNETTFSTSDAVAEETAIPSNLVISCSSQREVKSTASTLDPEPSCSSQKAVDGILLHDFTTVSSLKQNESKIYSNDIGEWPSNFDRDYWIAKGSSELQHMNSDFLSSKKIYEKENKPRFCQKSFFSYKHKLTNKTHVRDWLCYSETKGRLFCFVCKVTNSDTSSPRFTKDGLDDWKNAHNLLTRHEESTPHRQAIISLSSDQDLNTGYALYETVYAYVQAMRSTFSDVEAKAKDLTDCEEYQQQTSRRSKRNTKCDHFTGSTTLDNFVENQTPGQRFEIQVFIVIIDNVLSALTKRMEAYHEITGVFGIFRQLKSLTTEEILENASRMVSAYEDDLESSLGDELVQFAELLKTDVATVIDSKKQESLELQFYKLLLNNSLESCFPNVEIALRIYLSLMITNCSGERSFSTLKRIKNELRNTMGQERLNHLTLMNIEYNLLKEVDSESVISKFAHIKCRKVYL
ncbi:unnamed protein product [Arctia plantaginis]|uniref:HAT C-terminal dimerisation domain-containing protein n=2 Tax=Arctia plantaginis TaxID=874455 RepID=A0A8S0ZV96_ARCPL|nr:unnamed protein product [Arctia plantaginis]